MKFNDTLTTLVSQALEVGAVPALMGEPGIGKSSFVEDLARSMNTQAFVLPCNQLADKADLTGARLVPYDLPDGSTSYKQVFYPHQVIQDAIDYALSNPREYPVLFLDEINRTTSDVTSGVLTLVTLRRMGHVDLPANVRLMVAGNDRGNVTTLDEASLSRFAVFHVEPDASTLISVLGDAINPWVKQVLVANPSLVFQKSTPDAIVADGNDDDDDDNAVTMADLFDGGEEMNQLTTPRTIDSVSRWLNAVDRNDLSTMLATPVRIGERDANILQEAIEAYVGDTMFAVQLLATIAQDLASGGGAAGPRVIVAKPSCYDDFAKAGTITDLESLVSRLTVNELSGSLVYALSEKTDNSRLIGVLAENTQQIDPDHMRSLMEILGNQMVGRANLQALVDSNAPIANKLSPVLSVYL